MDSWFKMSVDPRQVVIVRIWRSGRVDPGTGEFVHCGILRAIASRGNVGHASIQIGDQYVSLWPNETIRLFRTVDGEVDMSTPEVDMYRESYNKELKVPNDGTQCRSNVSEIPGVHRGWTSISSVREKSVLENFERE